MYERGRDTSVSVKQSTYELLCASLVCVHHRCDGDDVRAVYHYVCKSTVHSKK